MLKTFVESLVVAFYLTNKRRSEIQPSARVFTRDSDETLVVDYMPMSIDRHPASASAPRSEEALLVTYREEIYRVEHLAEDPQTHTSRRVQEILDDGWMEAAGTGGSWWSPLRFDGIVTWRGADSSRIDATFLPRKVGAKRTNRASSWRVDRMQGVEASGEVLWRLRLVDCEDSPWEHQWALVLEDFTGEKPTIYTADCYHNKGHSLTVHWDNEPSSKYAVPDPDPLPIDPTRAAPPTTARGRRSTPTAVGREQRPSKRT